VVSRLPVSAAGSTGASAGAAGVPRAVVFGFLDLGEGGAQRQTLAACGALRPERFRATLLCARGDGPLVGSALALGLPVRLLGRLRRPFDVGAVAVLAAELRRLRADILHVPLYSRSSPYFRLAARLAGVPLVVAHDWSVPGRLPRMRRSADRLLRRGTRFIAASRAQERELLRAGVRPEAIAVQHPGIDVERFAGGDRRAVREALGLEEGRPVALVPARLVPAKGHDDLISALPAMLARVPRLTVLFAGAGPLEEALRARLRREGLDGSVRLLGHWEAMPELLAASDLVILPSRVEGLPGALLEAYAAVRAVVATDAGGIPEALTDRCEGRLVPVGDPAALAAAVVDLLERPEERRAMAARGRERVERDFRLESATRRLEETYERWLATARRRPDRAC
jgi:glycosyltransferase involved in cell wall biosynthesis